MCYTSNEIEQIQGRLTNLEKRINGIDADRIADIHYEKERIKKEADNKFKDLILMEDIKGWSLDYLIQLLLIIKKSNFEAYLQARHELDEVMRGN